MNKDTIKEIHRVYNEIVVPQILDRETLFKTYKLINGIDTQNVNLCRHCITSFCMNYPIIEEENKIDKRTKEYKDGKKEI